jgi:penicillin-binding protein 2
MKFTDRSENAVKFSLIGGSVVFGILALRLLLLQLILGGYYGYLADTIRARVIPEIAPRGVILDRNGSILAESKIIYNLEILPYQIKNTDYVFRFLRGLGIETANLEVKLRKKAYLPYEPIPVKNNLSPREISYLEENRELLPGVMIRSRIIRYYPNNNVCAHVLGYVGEINKTELNNLKKFGYQLGDIIGLAGVERYYDTYLKGIDGRHPLEVDPFGNPVRKLASQDPIPGSTVHLTIDLELQKKAEELFGERKGAVVILNPNTGEILTMFSKPDYNPNFFTDFLTDAEWKTIRTNESPLHNRALSGYPPGSTFKIFTLLSALEKPGFNERQTFFCQGYMYVSGRRFDCWDLNGHGRIDIYHGFIKSCDVVFYNLGLLLGADTIARTAASCGLGLATGIDLPYEATGFIPTERWKQRTYKQPWYPGDSLNMAIGQGYDLVTPLQLATAVAALANNGSTLYKPYLLTHVESIEGKEVIQQKPEKVSELPFDKSNLRLLRRLMAEVVDKGTGMNAKLPNLTIAGKTGTAEVLHAKPHAWFVSFAPAEKPELAMVVLVETGGHGGEAAAGISRDIYNWWNERRTHAAQ